MAKWKFSISGKTFTSTKGFDDLYNKVKASHPKIRKPLVKKMTKYTAELYIREDDERLIYKVDEKTSPTVLRREFGLTKKEADEAIKKISNNNTGVISNNYKLSKKVLSDDYLDGGILKVTIGIKFYENDDKWERRYRDGLIGLINVEDKAEFDKRADEIMRNYIEEFPEKKNLVAYTVLDYHLIGTRTNKRFEMKNMRMRKTDFIKLFNESLIMFKPKKNTNCVKAYLKSHLKRIAKATIEKLGNKYGVTPEEIKAFCIKYSIKYRCYDINGTIISSYTPPKINKNHKKIAIMIYNNHIYPIVNKYIVKDTTSYNKPVIIENSLNTRLSNMVNKGIHPVNIKLKKDDSEPLYIETENNVYLDNDIYTDVRNLFKKLGIEEKVPYDIDVCNVGNILEKLYLKSSVQSYFPKPERFTKGGFTYSKYDDVDKIVESNITTIDKNKCYPHVLANLPYLIKVDYRSSNIIKPVVEIVDHYLYLCKPYYSSLLMPDTNIYPGYLLKECDKAKVAYEILEGIETSKVENYYREMIYDLFKNCDDMELAKNIFTRFIGKFQKSYENKTHSYNKFIKIANNDELDRTDDLLYNRINNEYSVCFQHCVFSSSNIYNKKPISIQIIDGARLLLYNKINEFGIRDSEIIQIKTDAITYDTTRIDKKIIDDPLDFDGWKTQEFNPISACDIYDNNTRDTFKCNITTDGQISKLIIGNAGNGKTHHIINEIIPKIKGSYIVLTPSHASLKEYKKNNINSNVIQKYIYSQQLPSENTILVDEIGMCDYNAFEILIKSVYLQKNIICLGDFTQLLPPSNKDKQLDNKLFLDCLFNKQLILKGNKRNHFSEQYYNELRESEDNEYLIKEVKKHSTDWKDAEYIICYRNATVEKMNRKKLKHLGLEKNSIGARIMCKTNDLREKGIYNKFMFTIKDYTDDGYILDDNTEITDDEFENNFVSAYAVTLYCIQGSSIKSYHYPECDNYFINGRNAYTIISRLKTIDYTEKKKDKKVVKKFKKLDPEFTININW